MKNIILIAKQRNFEERRRQIVNKILSDNQNQIVLLITNPFTDNNLYKGNNRILNVMTSLELEIQETASGLNYEDIKNNKEVQLLVENYNYRSYADYQLDKYYYYMGLSFWSSFLRNNNIDIIITTMPKHGAIYDMEMDLAEKQDIPCIFIDCYGYNDTYCWSKCGKSFPVITGGVGSLEYILRSNYDKKHLPLQRYKKNKVLQKCYDIGGNLLEDFIRRIFLWDWSARSLFRSRLSVTWGEKFIGYLRLKSTERYLNSVSVQFNPDVNYVFYAMHFEPEASMQVRCTLENQLTIIKILSETVPDGWVVYVKEHPAQFALNSDDGYGFMIQSPNFKTKKFYSKILEFTNVKLIQTSTMSDTIIANSRAVSSIVGTVFFEAVLQKKPIITFSDLNPVSQLEEAFNIHSFEDCKSAMKIISQDFQPKYKDAEKVLERYVFKGETMAENILELIRTYAK